MQTPIVREGASEEGTDEGVPPGPDGGRGVGVADVGGRVLAQARAEGEVVDQALRGAPAAYSLPDICYMLLFQLLPVIVLPRLYRISTDSRYWGKM